MEDVHEDNDAEPRDYIREPVPRLPDHVGFLDEEEHKSLADKHMLRTISTKTKPRGTRGEPKRFALS